MEGKINLLADIVEPTAASTKKKVEINSARYDRSAEGVMHSWNLVRAMEAICTIGMG